MHPKLPGLLRFFFFFFNDTATTEIYTLSLHDALPIFGRPLGSGAGASSAEHLPPSMRQLFGSALPLTTKPTVTDLPGARPSVSHLAGKSVDRKSTRLNSSHGYISYAVFCLKKKQQTSDLRPDRQTVLCLVLHITTIQRNLQPRDSRPDTAPAVIPGDAASYSC